MGECLGTLIHRYPTLKDEIFDAQGRLLLKWGVSVNDRSSSETEKLLHPVKHGDVIALIPMIAWR